MQSSWNRPWLVGGGILTSASYAQLKWALSGTNCQIRENSVADVLLKFTLAVFTGKSVSLSDIAVVGDGFPSATEFSGGALDATRTCKTGSVQSEFDEQSEWDVFVDKILSSDSAVTLYTSGTSGSRILVKHSLQSLARGVIRNARHENDVWGLAFNPCHIAGLQVYLQALANTNTMVNLWGVDRHEIIERCRKWGVTHLSATPTFYKLLLPLPEPLPTVRSVSIGGEPVDGRLIAQLKAQFPTVRIRNIYALTEAGSVLVSDGEAFSISESFRDHVKIVDGHLSIHQSLLGQFAGAGEWYDTGDAVEVIQTEPLRFRIIGRVRDSINVGGEKVNPLEVEAALAEHPAVAVSRVFGRRNSVTGAILAADIVSKGGQIEEADLRDHLAQRLPAYKIPRIIRFVDRLELTGTGKVKRI